MTEITLKDGRIFNSRFADIKSAIADINDYLFCEYDENISLTDVAAIQVFEA